MRRAYFLTGRAWLRTVVSLSLYLSDRVQAVVDEDGSSDCAAINGVSLNRAKCKVMILGRQTYVSRTCISNFPRITINNIPLEFVSKACNLGVQITPSLDWNPHAKNGPETYVKPYWLTLGWLSVVLVDPRIEALKQSFKIETTILLKSLNIVTFKPENINSF
ncbi:hypothetical protein TSAR_003173 [Trichomalopsis sarcophagae]|uniref:Uncharacterized protein n=1 Tax=Trichomalopsis sarcophagae TaxID=543379 RepID=A0A232EFD7_9HYME|nr:hypothetical protein TSAR_003173 [Trichomalopsis sarcophagae]